MGFKYEVKERPEPDKIIWVCDECGSSDIESQFWATWDVATQKWVLGVNCEDEDYCNNCGERVTTRSKVAEISDGS